ncbi:hypothetical protein GCM10020001_074830 [Nonomuraea salmonea]
MAEYGQVGSIGQSRHRSAAPSGRSSARKCDSEPNDDTRAGGRPNRCTSQSTSWQALASSMGAEVSWRRQCPRTNECAWCHQPTGSRCCTLMSRPMRPSSSSRFTSPV